MKRLFGMMPDNCVEITKDYKDACGFPITIEAGKKGYTIMFADYSTIYKDVDNTAEENFNTALKIAIERVGELKEVKKQTILCNCK